MYPSQYWHRLRSMWLIFLLTTLAVFILSATSVLASKAGISGPTGPLTTSPADVLHTSATAMQQLKSVHFTLSISALQTRTSAPSSSLSSKPRPSAFLNTPGGMVADADVNEVLPDQTQASVGQTSKVPEVIKGGQVYIQTLKGKWYQFPSSLETTNCLSLLSFPKYTDPLATFLPLVQNTNFTDHGTEKLNGQNLRHISVKLGSDAFDALADLDLVYARVLGGHPRQELVKLDNAVLDVWIDEATSYVHHLTLKSTTSFDRSNLPGSSTSSTIVKAEKDLTVYFSQFNQIASIPTPANATSYVASTPPALPGLCPFQLTTVINAA